MAEKKDRDHLKQNMGQIGQDRMAPGGIWFRQPFLWILVGWLIIAVVNSYITHYSKRIALDYSSFRDELRRDNIERITMRGQLIDGSFKEQYTDSADGERRNFQYFSTMLPPIEDPDLMSLLTSNQVEIAVEKEASPWWSSTLLMMIPWFILILIMISVSSKVRNSSREIPGVGGLFGVGKSKARRFKQSRTKTTYENVAGLEHPKRDLQEIVAYLKHPQKFISLGAQIPRGVLLMGAPGTGKTLLARATAGEAEVPFFSISGSEFIEMFVGVGASRVRDMFATAKKEAPSIIFIDEIDSVGRSRGTGVGSGHDEREQTLNQILSEMDGFESNESVVVIAATNRPDVLDKALIRPGRFDRQIALELPQKRARLEILRLHIRGVPVADDVDLESIAAKTVGFSGAELRNLVNEAALLAGRRDRENVSNSEFENAGDRIILGSEREDVISEEEKRVIAYHESGHALTAILLSDTDPLQKVTIIPRGRAMGATQQIPENDRHNYSRTYLLNRICVAMGGRVSEKIVFDELTTGAAQDLQMATQLAVKMACQWGMSDRVGPVTWNRGEEHMFLGKEITNSRDFSEHTARVIDEETRRVISEMEERTTTLLRDNREKLDRLAVELIEHETLMKEDVEKIINGFD